MLLSAIPEVSRHVADAVGSLSVDDVLKPYIWVFYAAFIVSFLFTPIMQGVAVYYGIVDRPDRVRKLHKAPVAYLGGIAVFLGWLAGLAFSQFFGMHQKVPGYIPSLPWHVSIHFGIVLGACIIVVLGLWDDIRGISPKTKIVGQILAAAALLYDDIGTRVTEPLLSGFDPRLVNWFGLGPIPEWIVVGSSIIFVICAVVACCNATNLLDGLDGLCGGVTGIISSGFLFLAIYLAMIGSPANANWDGLRVILALALVGAVVGFVPYNFNPASIFMGDAGSMFLGYACAVMMILLSREKGQWLMASMVIFALPILDTSLAFARRWVNGRPFFSPDRHHFHHQLVARGLTVRKTVLVSYALALGFAVLGSAIVFMRLRYAGAIYLIVFGSIVVAAFKMGMIHERTVVAKPTTLDSDQAVAESPSINSGAVLEIDSGRTAGNTAVGKTTL